MAGIGSNRVFDKVAMEELKTQAWRRQPPACRESWTPRFTMT